MNLTKSRIAARHPVLILVLIALFTGAVASFGAAPAQAAATRSATWPSTWNSPLGGTTVAVSTNYGAFDLGCPNADSSNDYTYYLATGRTEHLGVDLVSAEGNDVYSVGSGIVKSAGTIWGTASKEVLIIEHSTAAGEKFIAAYGHITIASNPATGQKWSAGNSVASGAKIGSIATAGTGAHLHFGIEPGTGTYVDPTIEAPGTGDCSHQPVGTVDPLPYLDTHPVSSTCPEGNFHKVKRTNGLDGVRQVYTATPSCVFETWWVPGTTSPQTSRIIRIAQNNILDFDKVNLPNGVQSLYTAVPDGIWETNWGPVSVPSSAKIITLPNVQKVIAEARTENGQLTHLLYVLAADGPYEFWWQDGGDGIHQDRLANINNPVAFVKAKQPDGTEQVFTANAGTVFETRWHPGANDKTTREMIYISQLDIAKHNLPDGSQLLYTATKDNGVWQTYWAAPASPLHHGLLVNSLPGIKKVEKHVHNGVHQLYAATGNKVQEYWWHSGGSGGGTIVNTNGTADFDKTVDGSFQQVYTTDGPNIIETWWGGGQGPTSAELDVNQQS